MAFVAVGSGKLGASHRRGAVSTARRAPVSMAVSRRDFLLATVGAFGTMISPAFAQGFDLKELKEDVEKLKYEEEAQIKDDGNSRFEPKKKDLVGQYATSQKELKEDEKAKYKEAVAQELKEAEELKSKFSKRKVN